MALDTPVELARKLMGEQLREYRKSKGIKVKALEAATGIDVTTIYGIEAGRINFTIDIFAKLLAECGISFYDFLTGLKTDEFKADDRELHRKLQTILDSNLRDHIQSTRIALGAIQEQVERILNAQVKAKPHPPLAPHQTEEGSEPDALIIDAARHKEAGRGRRKRKAAS